MSDDYKRRSYGDTPVGFGKKPGIVVVDFMKAFTDDQYPLGGAPLVMRALENTSKLLEVARRYNVPIANCNTAYMNEREMPYWKISAVRETFLHDHTSALTHSDGSGISESFLKIDAADADHWKGFDVLLCALM